jgi:uncharacterized membrane protein (GlpM family)
MITISFKGIVQSFQETVKRFPLALLAAAAAAIIAVVLVEMESETSYLINILLTLILSFPLLVAARIFSEQPGSKKYKGLVYILIAAFLVLFLFMQSSKIFKAEMRYENAVRNVAYWYYSYLNICTLHFETSNR